MNTAPVTQDMIDAAAGRLKGHIRHTPLLSSPALDALAGRGILVKAECLQHTGSFKARGGWSAVSALPPEVRARGVIAYSSGNHAQGVARAAAAFGIPAVIVMPSDAPSVKIGNTRALGAEVVLYERASESREEIGGAIAAERGLSLIRPYDDAQVIAGQGTIGLELIGDLPAGWSGEVLVPCGGGGLSSGIALALEGSGARVRTVEPAGFDDAARSLAAGEILAFRHLRIVLEPGGAVALAAALFHSGPSDQVVAIASGGNVDEAIFAAALTRF